MNRAIERGSNPLRYQQRSRTPEHTIEEDSWVLCRMLEHGLEVECCNKNKRDSYRKEKPKKILRLTKEKTSIILFFHHFRSWLISNTSSRRMPDLTSTCPRHASLARASARRLRVMRHNRRSTPAPHSLRSLGTSPSPLSVPKYLVHS